MNKNIPFTLSQKAVINDRSVDESLIITGIASTTSKDRYDEYVTQETLESLCEQAQSLNLHYNHKQDEVIGRIDKAYIVDNQLHVEAVILPEYSKGLREKLEFGINYGLSIAGLASKNKNNELVGYDLVEISLTEEPVQSETYASVKINDEKSIECDCIGGLCYTINKELNMNIKDLTNDFANGEPEPVEAPSSDGAINGSDLNNALNELKGEILETIRQEFKDDVVDEVLTDLESSNPPEEPKVEPKIEVKEEVEEEPEVEAKDEDVDKEKKSLGSTSDEDEDEEEIKEEESNLEDAKGLTVEGKEPAAAEILSGIEKTLSTFSERLESELTDKFKDFQDAHFKKLDKTRNPVDYATKVKQKEEPPETNKKTIAEISKIYGSR